MKGKYIGRIHVSYWSMRKYYHQRPCLNAAVTSLSKPHESALGNYLQENDLVRFLGVRNWSYLGEAYMAMLVRTLGRFVRMCRC